jgi:tetratricopeptide (TPR) repeat protein
MRSRFLQALGISILLGGATALIGAPVFAPAAQAATVRPQVGKPLQAAVSLANAGKGAAAMAKVHEAESVGGLTGQEQSAISQTKSFIAAKTGAGGSALGCKAKFATDYNAGRYRDVVGTDAACLRKGGGFDFSSQVIVAQAYYLMGDYSTAIRLLKGLGNSDQVLSLLMSAAGKAGDAATEGQVAERMVLQGQSKYWTYMLAAADATRGLTDHENLDVYRIRYLTGNMRNAEDYELMTQLAIQLKFPTEALGVAQRGFSVKLLQGDRDTRLLNLAQTQAQKDTANLPNLQKQANAAKTGDLLASYGENLWGRGQYDDAVTNIQAGIKKGALSKADDAQISLGIAQLSAGHKDDAMKTFAAVKGSPAAQATAHLWTVYGRSGGTAKASANGASSGSSEQASTGTSKKRHH